jgi:hypothetical protein
MYELAKYKLQELLSHYRYNKFIEMFLNDDKFATKLDESMAYGSVPWIIEDVFIKLFGRYDDRKVKDSNLHEDFYNHYITKNQRSAYFKRLDSKYKELLVLIYIVCLKESDNIVQSIANEKGTEALQKWSEQARQGVNLREIQDELRDIARKTPVYDCRNKKNIDGEIQEIYTRLNAKNILVEYKLASSSILIPRPIVSDWIYLMFIQSIADGKGFFRCCNEMVKKGYYIKPVKCGRFFYTTDSRRKKHLGPHPKR